MWSANVGGAARVVGPSGRSTWRYRGIGRDTEEDEAEGEQTNTLMALRRTIENSLRGIIPVSFALFINVLDACTFGSIFFPSKFGVDVAAIAIEMFLLSTVVVQIVLIRYSSFNSGLGTAQAENIPFVHTMAMGVYNSLEATHTVAEMMPTVVVTVCVSTILNGLLFYVVGYFRLGNILHFFPRHVIMGMTAGFGIFLLQCGIESATGVIMANQTFSTLIEALAPARRKWQLLVVFLFEILLRIVEYLKFNELVVPCLMFMLPIAFYIILPFTGSTTNEVREAGWLFPETASVQWWETWSLFKFGLVEWPVVLEQWMTMASLAVFTLILVPIRIPSLSIITGDEVNFDEEFKAQGLANIVAGMVGAVHNYLSYSNSVFYFVVGGKGKFSQGMVAALTMLLFFVGPRIICFVPRCIAGVIMLHLGVDLVLGSLVTSRSILDSLEYTSVLVIAAVVSFMGFVPGVITGVASACATYIIQSSQQSSIRSIFSGQTARSNTSWSSHQRDRLFKGLSEGSSIFVIQLQGHLFFGNVQHVVENIESALKVNLSNPTVDHNTGKAATAALNSPRKVPLHSAGQHVQIRYLVLDCSFVTGADVNAVAGLLKLKSKITSQLFDCNQQTAYQQTAEKQTFVLVHVLFAGLQESLEAMFSLQEAAILRRQKRMHGPGEDHRKDDDHTDQDEGLVSPNPPVHYDTESGLPPSTSASTQPSGGGKPNASELDNNKRGNIPALAFDPRSANGTLSPSQSPSAIAGGGTDNLYGTGSENRGHMRKLSREYFSDANTALQAVEERIIKATPVDAAEGPHRNFTKRKSFTLENGEFLSSELRREHMRELLPSSGAPATSLSPLLLEPVPRTIAAAILASSSPKDTQRTGMSTLSSLFAHTRGDDSRHTSITNLPRVPQQPREATPHDSDSASVHSADYRMGGSRSPAVYPVASPPPVPHEQMSPASKQVKMQIANMLFDLSSQWTIADSPALKRLARRFMLGNMHFYSFPLSHRSHFSSSDTLVTASIIQICRRESCQEGRRAVGSRQRRTADGARAQWSPQSRLALQQLCLFSPNGSHPASDPARQCVRYVFRLLIVPHHPPSPTSPPTNLSAHQIL